MEGLTIHKKVTSPVSPTVTSTMSLADGIIGLLIFGAILVAIPFLLIGILIVTLRDKFAPPKPAKPIEPRPIILHEVPNDLFSLRYHCVMGDEISEGAWDYFGDDEPLIVYQSDTNNEFFKGYFSDFRLECPRGVFVQKVNFDSTLTEVESMPLCFFNYITKKSEEVIDLKGYTLYATKQPNYFTIIATNQEDYAEEFAASEFELEIILTDALYSPPESYNLEQINLPVASLTQSQKPKANEGPCQPN